MPTWPDSHALCIDPRFCLNQHNNMNTRHEKCRNGHKSSMFDAIWQCCFACLVFGVLFLCLLPVLFNFEPRRTRSSTVPAVMTRHAAKGCHAFQPSYAKFYAWKRAGIFQISRQSSLSIVSLARTLGKHPNPHISQQSWHHPSYPCLWKRITHTQGLCS